ncbi:MAG: putative bifunctional diguanylate cyclase/phosphodiesterase [Solirubrobacterales bacterium]
MAGPPSTSAHEHARWWKQAGGWQLRQLLFWRWDPIGVADAFPATYDEYDGFARPLVRRLHDGVGKREVVAYLRSVERDQMGFPPSDERDRALDAVAELIVDWYPESIERWREGGRDVREPEMSAAVVERLELQLDLKRALARHELELHYQPIVTLATGEIAALEALVRWQHPARGMLLPSQFVPLAEETGQILELGRWALGEACHQAAAWRGGHRDRRELEIAVNLSGAHLRSPGLVGAVRHELGGAGLDPSALVLEITETALVRDTDASVGVLEGLRALGVRIAIDDFGTGYSSLQYLSGLPIDALKIAKVFVDQVGGPHGDRPALARAIVELAQVFDLRVIAEGIERAEQVPALVGLGCELGQGNHFAAALSAEQAGALLQSWTPHGAGEVGGAAMESAI